MTFKLFSKFSDSTNPLNPGPDCNKCGTPMNGEPYCRHCEYEGWTGQVKPDPRIQHSSGFNACSRAVIVAVVLIVIWVLF